MTPHETTTLNTRLSLTTALFVCMGVTAGADKETRQHVWCDVRIEPNGDVTLLLNNIRVRRRQMSYSLFILHGSVRNIILYKRVFSMFHCFFFSECLSCYRRCYYGTACFYFYVCLKEFVFLIIIMFAHVFKL